MPGGELSGTSSDRQVDILKSWWATHLGRCLAECCCLNGRIEHLELGVVHLPVELPGEAHALEKPGHLRPRVRERQGLRGLKSGSKGPL